jgi:hypothetical protein
MMAGGDAAIRATQQATATVPILAVTEDMVGSGLVSSLARPGHNTTGISLLATELDGKRQEIQVDMVPDRIAALADPNTTAPSQLQSHRTPRVRAAFSWRYSGSINPRRLSRQSTRHRLRELKL